MKRNTFLNMILAAGLILTVIPQGIVQIHASDSIIPVYRVYNPNSGEHFFTTKAKEQAYLVSIGWNDEGIGFYEHSETGDAVYRLYNPNAGEHHYTDDKKEKEDLVDLGWNDEGIAFYSDADQEIEIYRAYNPNAPANNHNYTASMAEQSNLVNYGWNDEDIAWYSCSALAGSVSERRSTIYQLLTSTCKLNKAAACGILANIQLESTYNPRAVNDIDNGYYGLCQWDGKYRWTDLITYCRKTNTGRYSIEGQVDFMIYDLGQRGQLENLKKVEDSEDGAKEAAIYFCEKYEVREDYYDCDKLAAELYRSLK